MARFRGSQSGAAPLQIQIGASALTPAFVVGYSAMGEVNSGSASRPVITRPATAGTGTGTAIPLTPSEATAQSSLVTSFTGAPSIPATTSGSFNLPIRLRWAAPRAHAIVVPVSNYLLLYAAASGGYTWTGEIIWEEK